MFGFMFVRRVNQFTLKTMYTKNLKLCRGDKKCLDVKLDFFMIIKKLFTGYTNNVSMITITFLQFVLKTILLL